MRLSIGLKRFSGLLVEADGVEKRTESKHAANLWELRCVAYPRVRSVVVVYRWNGQDGAKRKAERVTRKKESMHTREARKRENKHERRQAKPLLACGDSLVVLV